MNTMNILIFHTALLVLKLETNVFHKDQVFPTKKKMQPMYILYQFSDFRDDKMESRDKIKYTVTFYNYLWSFYSRLCNLPLERCM